MKYRHLNFGPNRALRRKANAVARREPTKVNIDANNELLKFPRNKPFVNPKRAAKPRGKSARRILKVTRREAA